ILLYSAKRQKLMATNPHPATTTETEPSGSAARCPLTSAGSSLILTRSAIAMRAQPNHYIVHWRSFLRFFESPANVVHRPAGGDMDYKVDLDPTHAVIWLIVTGEIIALVLAEDAYHPLSQFTSHGGRMQPSMTYPKRNVRRYPPT